MINITDTALAISGHFVQAIYPNLPLISFHTESMTLTTYYLVYGKLKWRSAWMYGIHGNLWPYPPTHMGTSQPQPPPPDLFKFVHLGPHNPTPGPVQTSSFGTSPPSHIPNDLFKLIHYVFHTFIGK